MSPSGVLFHILEFLVWIILGAQSNLLNKLMTVWLFVFSQICCSQAQNSKRVFQDSILNSFPLNGRRWQWQRPACGAQPGCHERSLRGFCLGDRSFSEHSELEQGGAIQGQGPSRPSWRPCWDLVLSLSGLQVRLVGPAQWSFEGPRGIAATVVCRQGLLLQGERPVWGSQGAPDTAGQHLQQVYSEAAGAPFPPDGAAGVCTQRRHPVQGLGAGLGGWVGGQGGSPRWCRLFTHQSSSEC